jgi:hypothetical protein
MKHRIVLGFLLLGLLSGAGVILLATGVVGHAQETKSQPPVVTVPGTTPAVSPSVPSQPAVAVTEVKSPAAPAHYTDQAIWALMVSLLLQYLKKTNWFTPFSNASSARIKSFIGFAAAFVTAAGIHFAVSGNILDGGASITISGVSVNALKDVLWQWASQQAWYRTVVKET